LELSATFTSPAADPRFDSITSTVWIDVAVLDDDDDDLFGFASRSVVLDGSTLAGGSPTVVESYDPEGWIRQGEEPCSGGFSRNATFTSDSDAQSISHVVTHDCQTGGSSALQIDFADATAYSQDITWDGAGTATLAATHRDGTTVVGGFDEAGGAFTLTTNFPQGHDPVQVVQSGSIIGTTRSYNVVATFVDQSTESLDVTSELLADGTRSVTATATDADGTSSFAAVFDPTTGALAGSATGSDGGTIDFTITPQPDGTRLFVFTASDPVDEVTVAAILVLQADGSGCGTITIRRGGSSLTLPVCFDADGVGEIDGDPVGA
jgi:hypothetical protein